MITTSVSTVKVKLAMVITKASGEKYRITYPRTVRNRLSDVFYNLSRKSNEIS